MYRNNLISANIIGIEFAFCCEHRVGCCTCTHEAFLQESAIHIAQQRSVDLDAVLALLDIILTPLVDNGQLQLVFVWLGLVGNLTEAAHLGTTGWTGGRFLTAILVLRIKPFECTCPTQMMRTGETSGILWHPDTTIRILVHAYCTHIFFLFFSDCYFLALGWWCGDDLYVVVVIDCDWYWVCNWCWWSSD